MKFPLHSSSFITLNIIIIIIIISYASRSLSDREKAYPTTEREALAIIFAASHYRVYILGREFTLVTDHSALQWLQSVETKGRLARWVMALQEFRFCRQIPAGHCQ